LPTEEIGVCLQETEGYCADDSFHRTSSAFRMNAARV
jgi:hypothetical protein